MHRQRLLWGAIALTSILTTVWLFACGGGSSGGGGGVVTPTAKVSVAGQVTGSGGLTGVSVSGGGISTTTDVNGFYQLTDALVPASGRLVITFEKEGYATYQRSLPVEDGKSYSASATLAVYDVTEPNVDQTQPVVLEGRDTSNDLKVQLDLPANSLEGAAAGNVSISVAIGDPSTEAGRATFPGDYMAASAGDATPDTPLESVAFSEITITDSAGTEITQLTTPADLKLRLPDEFQAGPPQGSKFGTYDPTDPDKDSIEWWSYDETQGTWIREDADADASNGITDATVVDEGGVLFAVAKVTHFTWWNADRPVTTHACLCVTVEDDQQMVLPGVEIVAEGVSYNGTSYPALTDAEGRACVNVKKSELDLTPETVSVKARAGSVQFPYDVTSESEGNVTTDAIFTPTTQGSTIDNSGTCVDLANRIAVAFDGVVNGTVTYENSGAAVPNFTIYSSFGPTATTDATGAYTINVPLNVAVLLFAPGLASESVTVLEAGTPQTVDFMLPNRPPMISSLTRTPTTTPLSPGSAVQFTVVASDPDSDLLTYAWTADTGTPASGTGTTFNWTAPSTATTAHVSVTVTDAKGSTDTEALNVVVGGSTGGTTLKVTVFDDPDTNTPLQGVYVILHGTDNTSIQQTIVTNAAGVADFGDVGRSRVTLTIGSEFQRPSDFFPGTTYLDRELTTFVEVLAADVVYYADENSLDDVDPFCQNPTATVNVNVSGVSAAADIASLNPMFAQSFPPTLGSFTNVNVCPSVIQTDGAVSFLATAASFGNMTSDFLGYGFAVDQVLTDGATYDFPMDRVPLEVTWNTSPMVPVNSVSVTGIRKGVPVSASVAQVSTPASFGNLKVASEFPADTFRVGAFSFSNSLELGTFKKYATIAQTLTIPVPDYSIDNATYNDTTEVFSWGISGTTDRDLVSVSVSWFTELNENETFWDAILAPTATTWTVPDLPAPVSDWVAAGSAGAEAEIFVAGFDLATGFDDLWNQVISGVSNPDDAANEMFFANQFISIQGVARPAARAAATREPSQPSASPRGMGKLSRF